MKKPVIVHLVNQLSNDGTSRIVLTLCKLFASSYDISIVSLTPKTDLADSPEWPKNIPVRTFDFYYDPDYSLIRYFRLFFQRDIIRYRAETIVSCLRELNPDIVHCHIQPRELLTTRDLPGLFLYTDHTVRIKKGEYTFMKRTLLSWIYRRIYQRFHVIAVASAVAECHRMFRLTNKSNYYSVIENKIDAGRFVPGHAADTPLTVVYVARLEKRKGHDVLLNAWHAIEKKVTAELVLVGEGASEHELREQAAALGLKTVRFAGNQDDVLPFLQRAHVAVFPSSHEGLPLALLEKMACGLPVVVSDIPELRHVVTDRVNGLHFRTGDANDLEEKLLHVLGRPDFRSDLGRRARQHVLENFDMTIFRQQYEEAYDYILKSARS